jgi:hypothetical protein
MTDLRKSKILVFASTALVVLILVYNMAQEFVVPEIEGYIQRRIYYEKVILKKDLSEHKGMYWKETE